MKMNTEITLEKFIKEFKNIKQSYYPKFTRKVTLNCNLDQLFCVLL